MGNLFRSVLSNLVAAWLLQPLGVVMIFAVPFLAWLQGIPWSLILLFALATVGFVFWIANQVAVWKGRSGKLISKSNEKIENTLRGWLDKRGFGITSLPPGENAFQFMITDMQKRVILITRTRAEGYIQVIAPVGRNVFTSLPQPQQSTLKLTIGTEMARLGLYYEGFDNKPESPHALATYDELICDNTLTESDFVNSVTKVRRALVLIGSHIAQAKPTSPQVQV